MDLSDAVRLHLLEPPTGPVDVVIDTDTYNEVDDQFALAYLLRSAPRLRTRGICAAPFQNERAVTAREGMEKSLEEIHMLLTLMGRQEEKKLVMRGAEHFMECETQPVPSDAARHIIALALTHTAENPLYVVGIAAATNIASAILMEPRIKERIVVIWLGGNGHHSMDSFEFNMLEDVAAARVLFGCGVALVQLPCGDVVEHLTVSRPELEQWLVGRNALSDYLAQNVIREVESWAEKRGLPWTKTIWDVAAVAWLHNAGKGLMCDRLAHSPIPAYDHHYCFDARRHLIRYVYRIERDKVLGDLFQKLLEEG